MTTKTYPTTVDAHPTTGLIYEDSAREYARDRVSRDVVYRHTSAADGAWLLGDEREIAHDYPDLDIDALPLVTIDY